MDLLILSHEVKMPDRTVEATDRAGLVKIVGNVIGVTLNRWNREGSVTRFLWRTSIICRLRIIAPTPLCRPFQSGPREKMIVRHNYLSGFFAGVLVYALPGPGKEIIDPNI